jgi:hypothetical protein
MQHGEPGHRSGQRDVEPVQPARLGGRDPGWLNDDYLIEFQALGERDRHQDEPLVVLAGAVAADPGVR